MHTHMHMHDICSHTCTHIHSHARTCTHACTHMHTHAHLSTHLTSSAFNCFSGSKEGTDFHPAAKSVRVLLEDWPHMNAAQDCTAHFAFDGLPLLKAATVPRIIDTILDVHYTGKGARVLRAVCAGGVLLKRV